MKIDTDNIRRTNFMKIHFGADPDGPVQMARTFFAPDTNIIFFAVWDHLFDKEAGRYLICAFTDDWRYIQTSKGPRKHAGQKFATARAIQALEHQIHMSRIMIQVANDPDADKLSISHIQTECPFVDLEIDNSGIWARVQPGQD